MVGYNRRNNRLSELITRSTRISFVCDLAKLREVASLEGHVLLKKLRDALESLIGHFAGRNKEDVEKAIFMFLLTKKISKSIFVLPASEDAKKLVNQEKSFACAEIESARSVVLRIGEALEEQEKAFQASKPQMADENISVIDLDEEDMDNGLDLNLISHIQNQLQMRTQLGAMPIFCVVGFGLNMLSTLLVTTSNIRDFISQKERRRYELMSYLIHTEQCRDIIRMRPEVFINLCQRIRANGLVKDAFRSTVEEQVAKFLHIIGHNVKNRSVSFFFHRPGETVSRHFHNVLNVIILLEGELLVQPSGRHVHPYILNNTRFYPYFKDCLGAIDGTHVRVKVPRSDAPRFRGRKDWPTQNVFPACDFDMKFTYVLGGWEGTTSDSRILKDVLSREDPLIIPQGVESDESLLAEVDRELMEEDMDTMSTQVREADYRERSNIRDVIANEMWKDYQNN
ncbi:hypothetical protein Fmac_015077 [Flemingia macrophylla]|uniref:DDE Tnp4 domain-containing protein n=1 Tax=Flemingia macrophylla TaxID=520843 RepID=A0ABD1MDK4_9FABA